MLCNLRLLVADYEIQEERQDNLPSVFFVFVFSFLNTLQSQIIFIIPLILQFCGHLNTLTAQILI